MLQMALVTWTSDFSDINFTNYTFSFWFLYLLCIYQMLKFTQQWPSTQSIKIQPKSKRTTNYVPFNQTRSIHTMALNAFAGLTFQEHDSLLDVLRVLTPDQTPGIFKLGFFGHGSLRQLAVVLLLKFLPKHTKHKSTWSDQGGINVSHNYIIGTGREWSQQGWSSLLTKRSLFWH